MAMGESFEVQNEGNLRLNDGESTLGSSLQDPLSALMTREQSPYHLKPWTRASFQ